MFHHHVNWRKCSSDLTYSYEQHVSAQIHICVICCRQKYAVTVYDMLWLRSPTAVVKRPRQESLSYVARLGSKGCPRFKPAMVDVLGERLGGRGRLLGVAWLCVQVGNPQLFNNLTLSSWKIFQPFMIVSGREFWVRCMVCWCLLKNGLRFLPLEEISHEAW